VGVLLSGLTVVATGRGSGYIHADPLLVFWVLLAILAGGAIGLAAWASRADRGNVRAAAWALPVTVALGEAAATIYRSPDAATAAAVDLTLAIVVLAFGARTTSPAKLGVATILASAVLLILALIVRATVLPNSYYL
jgi:hypothetical protein